MCHYCIDSDTVCCRISGRQEHTLLHKVSMQYMIQFARYNKAELLCLFIQVHLILQWVISGEWCGSTIYLLL